MLVNIHTYYLSLKNACHKLHAFKFVNKCVSSVTRSQDGQIEFESLKKLVSVIFLSIKIRFNIQEMCFVGLTRFK